MLALFQQLKFSKQISIEWIIADILEALWEADISEIEQFYQQWQFKIAEGSLSKWNIAHSQLRTHSKFIENTIHNVKGRQNVYIPAFPMFKPNSDNSQKFVLSCNTGDTDLPLIEVKIANSFKSLIGTGAILSLIQPGTVEQLKKVMEINFIS